MQNRGVVGRSVMSMAVLFICCSAVCILVASLVATLNKQEAVGQGVVPVASTVVGGGPYSQRVVEASVRGIACRQLTTLSSAQSLPVVDGADRVSIQAESQNIRLRLVADGADPTATVGALIYAGSWYDYPGDPTDVRIIEATASATANLLYFDYGP